MVVYDARPSQFTQLTTIAEWEYLHQISMGRDAMDSFASFQTSFDVPGRNIVMSAGICVIRGQLWRCDASISTPIPAASSQNRIDRLVLRYNRLATTSPTVIVPTVITGTPASSPVVPPIVNTPTGLWDFPICYWTSQSSGGLAALNDSRQVMVNDVWHSPSIPSGWAGGINYRMMPDYTVALAGQIVLASSGSYNGITVISIPEAYWPMGDKYMPIVCQAQSSAYGNNSGSPGLPYVHVNTSGQVQLGGLPAGINGAWCFVDGCRYPLDF